MHLKLITHRISSFIQITSVFQRYSFFFITFYLSKGDVITCIQGARLSSSFAPFLRSPAWFGFAFSLQWFSIGCQVISNFHFILNDQHHRHHHHRANQKCNFSNHLKKAPSFTWFIWGKHLLLLGLFEESTLFYLVYSKEAPCLLGFFEESTLFYLVYLKKAPCFTWFIWGKHLVLLGLFEESTLFYLVFRRKHLVLLGLFE